MWTRLSLKVKLTILVVSVVSVASIAFFRFAAEGLLDLMDRATGLGAMTAAEGLATLVDANWVRTNFGSPEGDEHFSYLEDHFLHVINQGKIHRIILMRILPDNRVEHLLNIPVNNSPDYSPSGVYHKVPSNTPYLAEESGYEGVQLSEPGTFYAGWSPITNGTERVGVLLVIVDANEVQSAINTISRALMGVLGLVIGLTGVLAYMFGASFEKTAVTDGLMGIYNHKHFKQRLEHEVAKSRRYGQQTSLVLLDIDYFKRINDTYGHATGDLVLKLLARWVTESCRSTDIVARYGGEEIAVILPHTGLAGAQEFAERLRLKISEQVIEDPEEDAKFRVTVSAGVARWEKGMTAMDLIKRADAALYHSKNTGRNRVTLYQDEILPELPDQAQAKA